jgi:hypothetical protein
MAFHGLRKRAKNKGMFLLGGLPWNKMRGFNSEAL